MYVCLRAVCVSLFFVSFRIKCQCYLTNIKYCYKQYLIFLITNSVFKMLKLKLLKYFWKTTAWMDTKNNSHLQSSDDIPNYNL